MSLAHPSHDSSSAQDRELPSLMTRRLLPFALALLWTSALSAEALLPYQDPNRSDESRVDDRIERMTLTEKVGQMCEYVVSNISRSPRNS